MIKGIFPPIVTPFIDDEIAFEELEKNILQWNQTKLSGYVVMGSNGESAFLTFREKVQLTEAVAKYASSDKVIIAGTGSDSIKDTIALSNAVKEVGAKYALVLTPSFYKSEMKAEAFKIYFNKIADAAKIPIIIYNVPKFTGVDIAAGTISELSHHENIVGVKNSSENIAQFSEIISSVEKDFSVIVGTASILAHGLVAGASGGIVALANVAFNECLELFRSVEKNDLQKAFELQNKLIKPNRAVTSQFGIAGLKSAHDMIGFFGGMPRSPLQPLEVEKILEIKKIFSDAAITGFEN